MLDFVMFISTAEYNQWSTVWPAGNKERLNSVLGMALLQVTVEGWQNCSIFYIVFLTIPEIIKTQRSLLSVDGFLWQFYKFQGISQSKSLPGSNVLRHLVSNWWKNQKLPRYIHTKGPPERWTEEAREAMTETLKCCAVFLWGC